MCILDRALLRCVLFLFEGVLEADQVPVTVCSQDESGKQYRSSDSSPIFLNLVASGFRLYKPERSQLKSVAATRSERLRHVGLNQA